MKVCLVLASTGEGGLEDHVASLANSLAAALEVVVVAPASFGIKLVPGVTFAPLDLTRNRRNPFALWGLVRILRRHRPDIVHAHANKATAMVATIRRFYHAAYVATIHGSKRSTAAYGKFDHVIAVSSAVASTLPDVPCSVIYNGVSPASTGGVPDLRENLGIDRRSFLFGAIGRLAPVKRFDLLLNALASVDAVLLIIGDGPERGNLERLAADLGLGDKVRFLGFVPHAAAYMRQFDALVISSDREGFPYVFAEALLNRVPVIATDVTDIKRIVGPDFVVPVGDLDGLSRKLREAVNAVDLPASFSTAFDFAQRELTTDGMISKVRELYSGLIASSRRS